MSNKIYSCSSTETFINKMIEKGYEAIQTDEGACGIGNWVLISGNPKKYNFIIREKFLNEWSSGQTIRRAAKLSKAIQAEIDNYYE